MRFFSCLAIFFCLHFAPVAARPVAAALAGRVVLLVPGMSTDLDSPPTVFGEALAPDQKSYSGLIGFLQQKGLRYGGVIGGGQWGRGVAAPAAAADFYVVRFSPEAVVDGLGMKALEVAEAIRLATSRAGVPRASIVAHSAGGLAARVYMQGALPGLPYRGDVDRLITLSTPHFGSSIAGRFGEILGTRATSLSSGARLIERINTSLDLPRGALYASLVVRLFGSDLRSESDFATMSLDRGRFAALPVGYRRGGDQVLPAASQNLALVPVAAPYERSSGRPILYPLVLVEPPAAPAGQPEMRKAHNAAPRDLRLMDLVAWLLAGDGPWHQEPRQAMAFWVEKQAGMFAADFMAAAASESRSFAEIVQVKHERLLVTQRTDGGLEYHFRGQVLLRLLGMAAMSRTQSYSGVLRCFFDPFGRLRTVDATLSLL